MTEANYHVKNLTINGVPRRIIGKPETTLLTVIRDQLKMTGTKRGCDHGQCGVCNVILNGKVVRSCITKWKNVPEYSEVTTIEGIGTPKTFMLFSGHSLFAGRSSADSARPDLLPQARLFLTATPARQGKKFVSGTASIGWPAAARDTSRSWTQL